MKYFGYYADEENVKNLNCTPAAVDKMDYIASVLKNICNKVEIISVSTPRSGKLNSQIKKIDKGITLKFFTARYYSNKFVRIVFRYLFFNIKVLFWALINVKRNEKIIVYHSLGYIWLFQYLKKIKKIRIILEVEEIYADVLENTKVRQKELAFFNLADAYIFPTQLLDEEINKGKKESVIVHGTYKIEKELPILNFEGKENASKIHCVYAGTFDPRKGGADAAILSAAYLPENYHMHVLGFGVEKDVERIENRIREISRKSCACITYEGMLSGEDYIRFLQSCNIGLSTQNPNAQYNDTSFPSKILSYMSNGLRVVSARIPVVENSKIGSCVYYYDEQTPICIAKAIKNVDLKDKNDSKELLKKLNKDFENDFMRLLKYD